MNMVFGWWGLGWRELPVLALVLATCFSGSLSDVEVHYLNSPRGHPFCEASGDKNGVKDMTYTDPVTSQIKNIPPPGSICQALMELHIRGNYLTPKIVSGGFRLEIGAHCHTKINRIDTTQLRVYKPFNLSDEYPWMYLLSGSDCKKLQLGPDQECQYMKECASLIVTDKVYHFKSHRQNCKHGQCFSEGPTSWITEQETYIGIDVLLDEASCGRVCFDTEGRDAEPVYSQGRTGRVCSVRSKPSICSNGRPAELRCLGRAVREKYLRMSTNGKYIMNNTRIPHLPDDFISANHILCSFFAEEDSRNTINAVGDDIETRVRISVHQEINVTVYEKLAEVGLSPEDGKFVKDERNNSARTLAGIIISFIIGGSTPFVVFAIVGKCCLERYRKKKNEKDPTDYMT